LELVATLEGHLDRVWLISWHPKKLELASCSGDKTVRIWKPDENNLSNWTCIHVLEGTHERTIRSVAYSPLGDQLATAGFDAITGIWEKESNEYHCIATLEGHENEVKSVAWSTNGSLLATCSRDKSVWIWQTNQHDEDFECISVLQEHSQDVKMVMWHPKEELLVSASYDNTIRFWTEDEDDWYCSGVLQGHQSTVWSIDFNRDGNYMVSASDDKTLKVWTSVKDPTRRNPIWKCIETISGQHDRCIYSVSWSKIHDYIATASADNHVRIFSVQYSKDDPSEHSISLNLCWKQYEAHGKLDVNASIWCPLTEYGQLLATAGDDGLVRIWRWIPS
jgi:WD40 repeat protein